MEHVVFYPGPDGVSGFRRFASLEEAVGFVEHLRNSEGVEDVSVHTLSPVPVAFRAYYKVEVPLTGYEVADVPAQPIVDIAPVDVAPVDMAPMDVAPVEMPAAAAEMPAEPGLGPVDAGAGGKRSLGFFAH